MKKNKSKEPSLKDLEKIMKPKLIVHICYGLIYIGPYLHLYLIHIEKTYDKLLPAAILTGISLPLFTLNWVWYFYSLKHYKANAKELYEVPVINPKEYNSKEES